MTIGPCLIGRQQTIPITALVEGEPILTCNAPLIDVDVRPAADGTVLKEVGGALGDAAERGLFPFRAAAIILANLLRRIG